MQSKWVILEALLLLGGTVLLAPNCVAGTAETCTLSPKMFDRRTTVEPLGEAQREIDHKYVQFMKAVAQSYEQRNAAAVNGCCDAAKEDIIGFQFCALVRYLLSDRKEPGPFLAAMPGTYDQRKAFWSIGTDICQWNTGDSDITAWHSAARWLGIQVRGRDFRSDEKRKRDRRGKVSLPLRRLRWRIWRVHG